MTTEERLQSLYAKMENLSTRSVGYPVNQDFDYSELLPFMEFSINNVGDPFHESNFTMNTHEFEREVIGIFSDLMHIPRENSWGYVTSGGTRATCTACTWRAPCSPTASSTIPRILTTAS